MPRKRSGRPDFHDREGKVKASNQLNEQTAYHIHWIVHKGSKYVTQSPEDRKQA